METTGDPLKVQTRNERWRNEQKHYVQDINELDHKEVWEVDLLCTDQSNKFSTLRLSNEGNIQADPSSDSGGTKRASVASNDKENISEASSPLLKRAPVCHLKKKLLILDMNGLLVSIFFQPPKAFKADINIAGRAIFRRPFCAEFLSFCFERFEVGIWSSRKKKNIVRLVDYLLGDMKHKLLFCWDMSYCTETQFKTLENKHKALVFKELRRVWDKYDPALPWEKGYYNESNTLLLDDSPYKALLNPVHTAVFPFSYQFQNKNDDCLGAGGDIRVYLEGLAGADDVQKYVEQHPFGQSAITEGTDSWGFYHQVINTLNPLMGNLNLSA